MQKINLNYRHIIAACSYLFLTVSFFLFGYFWGFSKNKVENTADIVNASSEGTATPYSRPTAEVLLPSPSYRVILEDGELRLYTDENSKSRLISSEKISEDSYPVSDIASLKKGLEFNSADEAVALMENFIS